MDSDIDIRSVPPGGDARIWTPWGEMPESGSNTADQKNWSRAEAASHRRIGFDLAPREPAALRR